ncbi:hypothetical protein M422DRAFT_783159 [Sphaerobolus stellatus SS14]|uniref:Uncharacterized protein n=1 Tax=Sphaerobolus stellatus (strain SS14) TaxID=990650 RepID=A0A0C9V868_SPHS4|nr:hypothetical protein M422DRAFT_783159 [Sphaerobolus stellatus SS14]
MSLERAEERQPSADHGGPWSATVPRLGFLRDHQCLTKSAQAESDDEQDEPAYQYSTEKISYEGTTYDKSLAKSARIGKQSSSRHTVSCPLRNPACPSPALSRRPYSSPGPNRMSQKSKDDYAIQQCKRSSDAVSENEQENTLRDSNKEAEGETVSYRSSRGRSKRHKFNAGDLEVEERIVLERAQLEF